MPRLNTENINNYPPYDPRNDLGYGRLGPSGFNQPRSFLQYPEEPEEDIEAQEMIDDGTYDAVLSRLLHYFPGDPLAKNKTDPFHFVDGATKLSELSTAKGMVPFPKMYKNKQAVAGGTAQRSPAGPTLAFRTRIRPTGTKRGFSQPPAPIDTIQDITGPKFNLKDIIDANPDDEHLKRVRSLVRLIHDEQAKES